MPPPRPIVVVGSLNTDFVTRTPHVPAPGETDGSLVAVLKA